MIEETLRVTGMYCPNCTSRVEKAVCALEGVESAQADYEQDTCVVTYDGSEEVCAAVEATIEGEGFVVER